jgi:hypothetical protein
VSGLSERNAALYATAGGYDKAACMRTEVFNVRAEFLDRLLDAAREEGPVREPVPAGDVPEVWLRLIERDGEMLIRRWQSTPFEGGIRYARQLALEEGPAQRASPATPEGFPGSIPGHVWASLPIETAERVIRGASGPAPDPLPDFRTFYEERTGGNLFATSVSNPFIDMRTIADYLDELRKRVTT